MTKVSVPGRWDTISKDQGTIQFEWQEVMPIWMDLHIHLDGIHVANLIEGNSREIPVYTGEHELYVKRNWIGGSNRLLFTISPNEKKLFRITLARSGIERYLLIGSGRNELTGILSFLVLIIFTPFWFNRVYKVEETYPNAPPPPGTTPIPIWKCILYPAFFVGVLLALLVVFAR